MKYMIYGAGKTGEKALYFFGSPRVERFIDNHKAGSSFLGKSVVSLENVLPYINEYIVIVASEKHFLELSTQLKKFGVKKYFVFREYMPSEVQGVLPYVVTYGRNRFMYYDEVMANYEISKYRNVVIYGVNEYLPCLLAEIGYQNHLDNVVAIVDKEAVQEEIMGIPVRTDLYGLEEQMDALVINKRRNESPIRDELPVYKSFDVLDIYSIDKFVKYFQYSELKKYKNIHKGKRVFIIGNGPSLTVEDLELLHEHHEICFAANQIYKVYEKTQWRANYLMISDAIIIRNIEKDIPQLTGEIIMSDNFHCADVPVFNNVNYVHMIYGEYYPNYPGFHKDITQGLFLGYSVIYEIGLPLAAYMGFSEIYLLGVDHSWTKDITEGCNHFIKDYYNESLKTELQGFVPDIAKINKAFEKAKLYSEQNGFKIFNATRGGKLEIFDRVDFDSLF